MDRRGVGGRAENSYFEKALIRVDTPLALEEIR
jgi:hypothetical protein